MTGNELRQKYLDFFTSKGHKVIPSASLVPENDPTTLFTSSGMQPLIPYLLGEPHPSGSTRLVNSQKCFRAQDIEEVGDNRHTTFFEMLGNWSLGDYFKEDQLSWIWEFFTKELQLPKEKLHVTIFKGEDDIPRDEESYDIWKKLGLSDDHIHEYGVSENWWSRSGPPDKMPAGEIGGPDSEIFFEFTQVKHSPKFGKSCHPNCDCGRFLEIGNSVFIQYQKQKNGSLKELAQKNVDFGGGLERILAAVNNEPDIFKTDIFQSVIEEIEKQTNKKYADHQVEFRIIADHLKASVFMIAEGLEPSNKQQGYILRRLIRRTIFKLDKLGAITDQAVLPLVASITKIYKESYLAKARIDKLEIAIRDENEKFSKTMHRGMVFFHKHSKVDGRVAFNLFQTYGFPFELTKELAEERGESLSEKDFKIEFIKHQNLSRSTSKGMFKGGLADHSEITTKYHTATHLLHASLRQILGDHVQQSGSNITDQRLRFDFTHPAALTKQELKQVENLINKQIDKNLPITKKTMTLEAAKTAGALAFFAGTYTDKVSVYSIGSFSKEVCGGPHVENTSQIGRIVLTKQESVGAGKRRLYAQLEPAHGDR